MPTNENAPTVNGGENSYQKCQLNNGADSSLSQDPIEGTSKALLAHQFLDEMRAIEILPNEAMLLERIRRVTGEFRLIVHAARAYLFEVAG